MPPPGIGSAVWRTIRKFPVTYFGYHAEFGRSSICSGYQKILAHRPPDGEVVDPL